MKGWIKFFGLSFFSDKIATEAVKRGFSSIALALLLSFIFFLFGYYGADVAPFAARYDGAESYKQFISNGFSKLDIEIKDGKASSEKKINSYISDGEYSVNGYNLIIDTRPSQTLIKFTQVAVNGEIELSYEEYLNVSGKEKEQYKIQTRYTDTPLEITEEDVKTYEKFLSENSDAQKGFSALDKNADDYDLQLYYLYVKYYYSSVSSVLVGAKAPVLRDYYYRNYILNGNAYYFYVFDNMIAGSFKTDGGVPVVFGGYLNKCTDGRIGDIHSFIKDAYYSTAGYTFTSYFVSAISQLPALIFIPLILALIMWGIGKAVKDGWEKTYGGCFKIVNSFVWVSALITAIVTFVCGWFAPPRLMYSLMPVIFGGVLLIRTAVYCILRAVNNAKSGAEETDKYNDIFRREI